MRILGQFLMRFGLESGLGSWGRLTIRVGVRFMVRGKPDLVSFIGSKTSYINTALDTDLAAIVGGGALARGALGIGSVSIGPG